MTLLTRLDAVPIWRRYRRDLIVAASFVAAFIVASIFVHPINALDYSTFTRGVKAAWSGLSPYSVIGFFMPPWSLIPMTPLTLVPVEIWLALDVAIFAGMVIDLGTPAGLLLLLNPAFITLIASSNAEWLLIGPGLWLLYRCKRGWGRGIAWLLLSCKPQAVIVLLIFDGIDALRTRDWKAFAAAAPVAIVSLAIYPDFFERIRVPLDWSISIIAHYGMIGAILTTAAIVAIRWKRLGDYKALGLLLSPVWTPYLLQYSVTPMTFSMRGAGLIRNLIYLTACTALAVLYWQDYHVAEHVGVLGMVLLAAILAPVDNPADQRADEAPMPVAAP